MDYKTYLDNKELKEGIFGSKSKEELFAKSIRKLIMDKSKQQGIDYRKVIEYLYTGAHIR